jgi:hypothetical protein
VPRSVLCEAEYIDDREPGTCAAPVAFAVESPETGEGIGRLRRRRRYYRQGRTKVAHATPFTKRHALHGRPLRRAAFGTHRRRRVPPRDLVRHHIEQGVTCVDAPVATCVMTMVRVRLTT